MSSSNRQPADLPERVTISSRSQSTQPTHHHHPGQTVFAEDEETESFYVVLDISGDDFAAYGKYRDGRKFRPRLGDRYYSPHDSEASDHDNDNDAEDDTNIDDDGDQDQPEEEEEDGEDQEEDPEEEYDDEEEYHTRRRRRRDSDTSTAEQKGPRELSLQILNLHSSQPLVNYEGKIYTCTWSKSNGTELLFSPPPVSHDAEAPHPANDEESVRLASSTAAAGVNMNATGRKLKQHPESNLFCTTVHRLEGWPGKMRPRGRDKQEVSTKARMFAERLDAVLEYRLGEMARKGEDVGEVTMKKFSEGGQQQP
ncbi:hypothetical protein TWF694_006957 [Orbilia ellipsospora]|uniref:Transcription factor TFIIIC triple barrel domain-containing protein n=1 Tax=Orbilia ellipsospora TaxID=2528407 RepID=A0AAV9XN80_9PEZI